jgi:hypothetical protein
MNVAVQQGVRSAGPRSGATWSGEQAARSVPPRLLPTGSGVGTACPPAQSTKST